MPRINEPNIPEGLRRRYGIRGAGPIDTLAPEIVPVVVVDSMYVPEMGAPRAGYHYGAGNAGCNKIVALKNQTDRLIALDYAYISAPSAVNLLMYTLEANNDPPGTVSRWDTHFLDTRLGGGSFGGNQEVAVLSVVDSAATTNMTVRAYLAVMASRAMKVDLRGWYLGNGMSIAFRHPTVATAMGVYFSFRQLPGDVGAGPPPWVPGGV